MRRQVLYRPTTCAPVLPARRRGRPGAAVALRTAVLAATAAAAFCLAACGSRGIGYGLLLWADPESAFQTGEVLRVVQESSIQETYVVRPEGSRELQELPMWRMRLFPSREEALAAAEIYAEFQGVYGYSERDGLPIREQPEPEARRLYKLRAGELVKVLSRGEEEVQVAGYLDYWYEVLTEDGTRGYCFGAYLPVFSPAGDPKEEAERLRARDPVLETLVSTPWRPEYFQEMADKGRVDLVRFTPEIGLFVDDSAKTVAMVTDRSRQQFEYNAIENVGPNRYVFVGAEDRAELRAHLQSLTRLVLSYTRNDQVVSTVYVAFAGDIEAIIAAEQERRQELYQGFVSRGRILSSTAYGSITLQDEMRFVWKDFGPLQELVFSRPVAGTGSVDFPYWLSPQLAERYDGVIAFRFREYPPREDSSFLYRFDPLGVRFESLRPGNIEDQEVVRPDVTPLVIYFSFGGS
ncbi:MAG: SH3 domain-containing protein [Spirochaetales bacterium]|nr:SH3 domain-containing protein [Spirochaetales bacterium]